MERYTWGQYEVEVDEAVTRAWYAQAGEWDCECGHCRNFMAVADQLPVELLTLLDQLGIPAKKAVYVCNLISRKGDRLLYAITYRVVGRILKQEEQESGKRGFLQKVRSFFGGRKAEYPDPWERFLCLDEPRMLCGLDLGAFPQPCFEMCIQLWLPWVLDEPIDG